MFDIYLNDKRDVVVVRSGFPVPPEVSGNWRRKRRAVRSVSKIIQEDVERDGYYRLKFRRSEIDAGSRGSG